MIKTQRFVAHNKKSIPSKIKPRQFQLFSITFFIHIFISQRINIIIDRYEYFYFVIILFFATRY